MELVKNLKNIFSNRNFQIMVLLNSLMISGLISIISLLFYNLIGIPYEIPLTLTLIFFVSYTGIAKVYFKEEELEKVLGNSLKILFLFFLVNTFFVFLLEIIWFVSVNTPRETNFLDFSIQNFYFDPLIVSFRSLTYLILLILIVTTIYTFLVDFPNKKM